MKAEFTFPPEFVSAVAQEVAATLRPLLVSREKEPDAILSPAQLAVLLGVPKGWVYEATAQKTIPYFKAGKYLRFRKSDVDKWIAANAVPVSRPPFRPLRAVK